MLLRTRATPLCVKRLYHTRYNGYWSLILEQATPTKPLPSLPASPRPTTALPPPTTSQTQQLTASPPSQEALTSDLHDQQQPPRPQFVWLRGEQLAIPQKPPPAENCCMRQVHRDNKAPI
ncbi:hypothetical protein BC940DRAFT_308411 [Gongronella butleri]|nr:hypothetical protein BC940DRAFT_308411 [Gongronella butleri]